MRVVRYTWLINMRLCRFFTSHYIYTLSNSRFVSKYRQKKTTKKNHTSHRSPLPSELATIAAFVQI